MILEDIDVCKENIHKRAAGKKINWQRCSAVENLLPHTVQQNYTYSCGIQQEIAVGLSCGDQQVCL